VNDMDLNEKYLLELQVFDGLIKHFKKSKDPNSSAVLLAYEHGRRVLEDMYTEAINQKEKTEELLPF